MSPSRNLIELEERDEALALGILRNIEGHIDVDHASQHPSDAALLVANQPPILGDRTGGSAPGPRYNRPGNGSGGGFLSRRALQNHHLRPRGQLVKMFGIAAGGKVQVGLVPQNAGSLHRIVLIVLRQLLQSVEGFLVHQEALLDPAFDAAGGTNAGKALFAFQDFHALTIFHVADPVIDGRNLVTQGGLRRRDISHFEHATASTTASATGHHQRDDH